MLIFTDLVKINAIFKEEKLSHSFVLLSNFSFIIKYKHFINDMVRTQIHYLFTVCTSSQYMATVHATVHGHSQGQKFIAVNFEVPRQTILLNFAVISGKNHGFRGKNLGTTTVLKCIPGFKLPIYAYS